VISKSNLQVCLKLYYNKGFVRGLRQYVVAMNLMQGWRKLVKGLYAIDLVSSHGCG